MFTAQWASLDNPLPAQDDEPVNINTDALKVELTVKDGDDDPISSEIGIGDKVIFEDDAPSSLVLAQSGDNVVHDETGGLQSGAGAPGANDGPDGDDVAFHRVQVSERAVEALPISP